MVIAPMLFASAVAFVTAPPASRANDATHEFVSFPRPAAESRAVNVTQLEREGYVALHDDDHLISRWVAYQVAAAWVDADPITTRGSVWRTDPELFDSGARFSDYSEDTYSVGHLAMQAVLRGRSAQCEREGMYLANAVPMRPEFNQGAWLSLEEQVISWARQNGAVWVVCGPAILGAEEKIGRGVTAPLAFYKIVARDTRDGGVEAIAFLFFQDSAQPIDTIDRFVTSIDRVEQLTQLDFFAELSDEVETVLESAEPTEFGGIPLVEPAKPTEIRERAPPPRRIVDKPDDLPKPIRPPQQDEPERPSVTVYVTRTGAKYHLSGCRYLRRSKIAISLEEARRRYGPCSVCKPPK